METYLALPPVVSEAKRFDQMRAAVDTGLPFLKKRDGFGSDTLAIIGFGPSLSDTWRLLEQSYPAIMATSGAYDFLRMNGIRPDYYCCIDPRESTLGLLDNPCPRTEYLMASVCHPSWWENLKGYDVKLWHLINDNQTVEWVKEHHPAGLDSMIGGGSTVAQRAMNVGAALGYRKFEVFGVDCSFVDQPHAGPHNAERQPTIEIPYNGRAFKTTPQLLQSAQELREFMLTADVEINFHGDGLIQEIARTIKKRKP